MESEDESDDEEEDDEDEDEEDESDEEMEVSILLVHFVVCNNLAHLHKVLKIS